MRSSRDLGSVSWETLQVHKIDSGAPFLQLLFHLFFYVEGLILYWTVGYYSILLTDYGFSQFDYTCILSTLSAGCTFSMVVPLHKFFPSDYLPSVLLLIFAVLALAQSVFISSYPFLLVTHVSKIKQCFILCYW